jgi:hypothetical protein
MNELGERQFVNLRSVDNISFNKGFIISRVFPEETETVEYKVEFNNTMPTNFTQLALGGRDPLSLMWQIELEPYSTFSYGIMRNNIMQVSINPKHKEMRDSIIYQAAPQLPDAKIVRNLQITFKDLL